MGLSAIFGQLGGAANSIAPVASGLGQLVNAIRGTKSIDRAFEQSQMPTAAEIEYNTLVDAITNPESARYKSTYDTQYKQGVDAFLRQLQLITQQSNRQLARGQRSSFFAPERADETINYLTTRGLPGVQAQAQEQTKDTLKTLANARVGVIPIQRQRQQDAFTFAQSKGVQQAANPLGMFGSVLKALQGFQQPSSDLPWQQPGMIRPGGGYY
jgi:hypothetical protein